MTIGDAEIAAASASLIACLGGYDWWTRGSRISLLTAAFGLTFLALFVAWALRNRHSIKDD